MQKYFRLLNFQLDVVVNDICKGNLDVPKLSGHQHYNCRKSEEEIAKAMKGNNRQDYLFGLKREFESYRFYQKQIDAYPEKKRKAEPMMLIEGLSHLSLPS